MNRDPEIGKNIIDSAGRIYEPDEERKKHIFEQILQNVEYAWHIMVDKNTKIVILENLNSLLDGDIVFLTHEVDAKIINSLGKKIIISQLRIPYESKELIRKDNYTQVAYRFMKCPDYLVPMKYLVSYRTNGKNSNTFPIFFHNFVRSQAQKAITVLLFIGIVKSSKTRLGDE
ncbi:MAG TPA: hypothetical protein P5052_01960 [Candidatus Paceibacterota bacterium]|nr:hypothetical protein [Candidatus Paceibacterota bacterium]